ncbi:DUF5058 family protein [Alkalihalobacillus deserti]|uniref:DUF5058 family protein n=1 Tax=Alkalihalobacillus deserti TaxID=2879466 RepID=UPI001D14775C|nr:DUF5058 family protein [Alkalihalobacillus deserti]
MDYLEIANSPYMWLAAASAVLVVFVQAFIFVKKSLVVGKEIGLSNVQMKSAMKSSMISSIGPSIVILFGLISLLVAIGGPMAWMRLSFIGSLPFELLAAGFGAEAMGVSLGSENMTGTVFANSVWTMVLGSLGWIVFTGLFTHKMEKMQTFLTAGKKELVPIISISAMIGAFAYFSADRILNIDKGTIALFIGAITMLALAWTADKNNIQWLKEWGLTIAMFAGAIIAFLV